MRFSQKSTWLCKLPARNESGFLKCNCAKFAREGSLTASWGGTVGPTKDKGSPIISHHVRSRLGSARMFCNATSNSWKQTENANKSWERKKGGRTPYPSLTPALIKDQNKALRNTPRVNKEMRQQRPKTTGRQTTLAKGFIKQKNKR